jgi:PIN domain nuclease of toxin-antitoxin system
VNYIADTHILLWSFTETARLSGNVKSIILDENNDIYYSPVSLWEISIKYRLKKLNLNGGTPEIFYEALKNSYYLRKEIDDASIITHYNLPMFHKDPFDRLLIWEAIRNDFTLLSFDHKIALYESEGLKIAR